MIIKTGVQPGWSLLYGFALVLSSTMPAHAYLASPGVASLGRKTAIAHRVASADGALQMRKCMLSRCTMSGTASSAGSRTFSREQQAGSVK
jgi:hypothetical protein